MADTKISQLPAVVAVSGTDEFAINQAFASKKVSTSQLQSYLSTGSFTGSMVGIVLASKLTQSDETAGFHNEGYTEWHELGVTPPTPDAVHARIYAADFHGFSTLNMLDSQGLVIRVGQDATYTVRNNSAVTITKGSIVHITGAQAGAATVVLAIASASAVMPADGIAVTDIAPASYGRVMIHGELGGIDTRGFLEGDTLFVSAVNAGQFVSVAPQYPYISQQVATVLTATSNGIIRVGIQAFDRSVVGHSFAISGSLVVTNSASFGNSITSSTGLAITGSTGKLSIVSGSISITTGSGQAAALQILGPVSANGNTSWGILVGTLPTVSETFQHEGIDVSVTTPSASTITSLAAIKIEGAFATPLGTGSNIGNKLGIWMDNDARGPVTSAIGISVGSFVGGIQSNYGIAIGAMAGAQSNYGINIGSVTGTGSYAIYTGQGTSSFGDTVHIRNGNLIVTNSISASIISSSGNLFVGGAGYSTFVGPVGVGSQAFPAGSTLFIGGNAPALTIDAVAGAMLVFRSQGFGIVWQPPQAASYVGMGNTSAANPWPGGYWQELGNNGKPNIISAFPAGQGSNQAAINIIASGNLAQSDHFVKFFTTGTIVRAWIDGAGGSFWSGSVTASNGIVVSRSIQNPFFDNGTVSASFTIDWLSGSTQMVTLASAGSTASFANMRDGQTLFLQVFQDNAGSRTITKWDATTAFPLSGSGFPAPSTGSASGSFSTVATAMDEFRFIYNQRKNRSYGTQLSKGSF